MDALVDLLFALSLLTCTAFVIAVAYHAARLAAMLRRTSRKGGSFEVMRLRLQHITHTGAELPADIAGLHQELQTLNRRLLSLRDRMHTDGGNGVR